MSSEAVSDSLAVQQEVVGSYFPFIIVQPIVFLCCIAGASEPMQSFQGLELPCVVALVQQVVVSSLKEDSYHSFISFLSYHWDVWCFSVVQLFDYS